ALGELDTRDKPPTLWDDAGLSLAEKEADWNASHTVWHAADFVAAFFVLGQPERALNAADFLLHKRNVPSPALALANRIAHRASDQIEIPEVQNLEGEALYREIHALKNRSVREPRNAIVWVDLARAYTLAGETELGRRAMTVACSISPDNRFVLRSAARLFVHQHDALHAHRLLTTSIATPHDPWLLAAEIGVASTAGMSSVFTRPGRGMLGSAQHSPLSLTELSSALAS